MTQKITFRLSNDEFVNEGAAEIARLAKQNTAATVDVEPTEITIQAEDPVSVLENILFNELSPNTHRRSSIARYYDVKHVDTPVGRGDEAFPEGPDRFNGSIEKADLENASIPISDDIETNIGDSIYTLSPMYTGDPTEFKTKRATRYVDMLDDVDSSFNSENPCTSCSREDLPNWKYDGDDLEYNQKFTHYVTKNGYKALGQKGTQKSSQRGRCLSCLLAGFAYTLISKPFYTTQDRDYRIFTVDSQFDGLVKVREQYVNVLSDMDPEIESKDDRYKVLSSNLPSSVRSDEGRILDLLSRLVDSYSETKQKDRYSEEEFVKIISGVLAYTSSNSKGGQPVRGITSISRYELFNSLYPYLKKIDYNDGDRYTISELLGSLSSVGRDTSGPGDNITRSVSIFSKGIMQEDPRLLSSGLFGLAKPVVNETEIPPKGLDISGSRKYLVLSLKRMTKEDLSEEDVEAICSVGEAFGSLFDTRDDVSVLIGLKNANNVEQLRSALEEASMEGMKKSTVRGEKVKKYQTVWHENLERLHKILSDPDKFDSAKSVLVSSASMSALHSNVTKQSSQSGASNKGNQTNTNQNKQ